MSFPFKSGLFSGSIELLIFQRLNIYFLGLGQNLVPLLGQNINIELGFMDLHPPWKCWYFYSDRYIATIAHQL